MLSNITTKPTNIRKLIHAVCLIAGQLIASITTIYQNYNYIKECMSRNKYISMTDNV